MEAYIYSAERQYALFHSNAANQSKHWNGMEVLKAKTKELKYGTYSCRTSTLPCAK